MVSKQAEGATVDAYGDGEQRRDPRSGSGECACGGDEGEGESAESLELVFHGVARDDGVGPKPRIGRESGTSAFHLRLGFLHSSYHLMMSNTEPKEFSIPLNSCITDVITLFDCRLRPYPPYIFRRY